MDNAPRLKLLAELVYYVYSFVPALSCLELRIIRGAQWITKAEMSRNFRIEPVEEALYEQVASEIVAGQIKQGLWLKATVESDGDDFRARTIYTKFRVEQLKAELPKPSAAEATMKAQSEENLRREQQEEATRWRKKNSTKRGYTPQEQTRMNKQIIVALVVIVLLFVLLLGASLVVLN